MVRTNWSNDPFVLGAYSYTPTGVDKDDWWALIAPVGRIWFAGEHTHSYNSGFLHGAVDSGTKAAKNISMCAKDPSKCPCNANTNVNAKRTCSCFNKNPQTTQKSCLKAFDTTMICPGKDLYFLLFCYLAFCVSRLTGFGLKEFQNLCPSLIDIFKQTLGNTYSGGGSSLEGLIFRENFVLVSPCKVFKIYNYIDRRLKTQTKKFSL